MADLDKVWVGSAVAPDGRYVVEIDVSDGRAHILPVDAAPAYAATVVATAMVAAYDAAVVRQIRAQAESEMPPLAVGQMIAALRETRAPLTQELLLPLSLVPGVSGRTWKPFLTVLIDGKQVGQWSTKDAYSHALAVLEMAEVVKLDAGYRDFLVETVGLDPDVAMAAVTGLADFRDDDD